LLIRPTIVLSLAAGSCVAAASADVVIQPTAVPDTSTWRSCVPPTNVYNGNGLSAPATVTSNSPIPAAWPTHGTDGCNNMWHTSCPGQSGSTCEGGDTTPYIVFDLGTLWNLTGFHLWNHNQVAPGGASETNRGIRNMNVQVSADGINYSSNVPFTNMLQGPGSTAYAGDDYALPASGVRFVKFTVLNNWGGATVTGISEIRFKGVPQFGIVSSAVTPGTVELCGPQNAVISTRVVGLAAGVTATVSASGGPVPGASVSMLDNGLGGDAVAGDGIYSASVTVPAGYPLGDATINISASDSLGHTGSAAVTLSVAACVPTYVESGDAGDLPATAAVASGSGPLQRIRGTLSASDVDMYRITICDGNSFSATTFGGTTLDTQLFLFDTAGLGIAFNDDVPDGLPGDATLQSTINGFFNNGDYYLAVTLYDRDPQDASAQDLWLDTPFNTVRAPDGAGAFNPVAGWTGTFAGTGAYAVNLTGACFVQTTPSCPADIGVTGGTPGQDGALNNNDFIVFIDYFFAQHPLADRGSTGGVPGADGVWNNNDFVVFIDQFFAGCVN